MLIKLMLYMHSNVISMLINILKHLKTKARGTQKKRDFEIHMLTILVRFQ